MDEEVLETICSLQEELCQAKALNFELQRKMSTMTDTISTLLNLRCKRGESSFVLTNDLIECIHMNFEACVQCVMSYKTMKSTDLLIWFLLHLLTGVRNTQTPCAVLDM